MDQNQINIPQRINSVKAEKPQDQVAIIPATHVAIMIVNDTTAEQKEAAQESDLFSLVASEDINQAVEDRLEEAKEQQTENGTTPASEHVVPTKKIIDGIKNQTEKTVNDLRRQTVAIEAEISPNPEATEPKIQKSEDTETNSTSTNENTIKNSDEPKTKESRQDPEPAQISSILTDKEVQKEFLRLKESLKATLPIAGGEYILFLEQKLAELGGGLSKEANKIREEINQLKEAKNAHKEEKDLKNLLTELDRLNALGESSSEKGKKIREQINQLEESISDYQEKKRLEEISNPNSLEQ